MISRIIEENKKYTVTLVLTLVVSNVMGATGSEASQLECDDVLTRFGKDTVVTIDSCNAVED
jgi:hypothetical protein